ncbi:MAG TPA: PQQ-dependent sugar dehydrogenase [Hymenobacter sp.]|uniref:PQQ-dependent sugar dehydrogenase n=1 Tax=Hymenobacter sp. TaxID=1898978 RepID=UPI002D7E41B4|nr:PQQ-dependent sugar dehydrogenase [Hymenobacter sp.]HET9504018.1 PQQ-dependent sugar dehydrogenase [Hymenobacter sp.]
MNRHVCFLVGCSLALGACSQNQDEEAAPDATPTAPVETSAPNTAYPPAFAGQTRASGFSTPASSYRAAAVTSGLTSPWGIAALPDGRLLITEKAGQLRLVTAAGAVSAPITGLPAVNPAGQGGLLGLCLDPDFASNRLVYWSFSEARPGGNLTAIGKGRLANDERTIENAAVIYRAEPAYAGTLHYGGRVVFDRTGHLLISTGERSDLATRPQAQAATSALGKVIRLTKAGQPAPGNPTFAAAGALPELYSIGHRNPQGLAVHPTTGEVWQSEHGPRGGDELNRLQAGANYGWPTITYGIEYSGQPIGGSIQQAAGLEQPVYYWDPVISPSGMTFYTSGRIAGWQNNLFLASLSGQHIARLVLSNNRVVGEERLLASEGQRFRDITQGADGALYAITDQGRLYRIDKP